MATNVNREVKLEVFSSDGVAENEERETAKRKQHAENNLAAKKIKTDDVKDDHDGSKIAVSKESATSAHFWHIKKEEIDTAEKDDAAVDGQILKTDLPERFRTRPTPVAPLDPASLTPRGSAAAIDAEVDWIFNELQRRVMQPVLSVIYDKIRPIFRNDDNNHDHLRQTIRNVISCMLHERLEVPFISAYRTELIGKLTDEDLWYIYDLDEQYTKLMHPSDELRPREHSPTPHAEIEAMNLIDEFITLNFGLNLREFALSVGSGQPRNVLKQQEYYADPDEVAKKFIGPTYQTVEEVKTAAVQLLAVRMANLPELRSAIRDRFFEHVKISVRPVATASIDDQHECFHVKHLSNKLLSNLLPQDFILIHAAAEAGLVWYKLTLDNVESMTGDPEVPPEMSETKLLYRTTKELFLLLMSENELETDKWNRLRLSAFETACCDRFYPEFQKEIQSRLFREAADVILREIYAQVERIVWFKPFRPVGFTSDDSTWISDSIFDRNVPKEWQIGRTDANLRIMGIAWNKTSSSACAVVINRFGEVINRSEAKHGNEFCGLQRLIGETKPQCVVILRPSLVKSEAERDHSKNVLKSIFYNLKQIEPDFPLIFPHNVLIVEPTAAFQTSLESVTHRFEESSSISMFISALAIAKQLLDPFLTLAQFCAKSEDDLLSVQFHPLQKHLPRDAVRDAILRPIINAVNYLGVDLNEVIDHQEALIPLMQFVCGLGPQSGLQLIETIKRNGKFGHIQNREQLKTFGISEIVYRNMAGFVRFTGQPRDDAKDFYTLDQTRIHPDVYNWALKIASDALDKEDEGDAAAKEQLMREIMLPKRVEELCQLDLDSFADYLWDEYGNKKITLHRIRDEFTKPFCDKLRKPYGGLLEQFDYCAGTSVNDLF